MRTPENTKRARSLIWLRRLAVSTLIIVGFALGGCDRPTTPQEPRAAFDHHATLEALATAEPLLEGRRLPQVNGRDATELELGRSTVRHVDVDNVLEQVVTSLEDGRRSTVNALRGAELGEVVDGILKVDGVQLYDIEAEELVREVYRRAEAHTAGQGDRVLAYLYEQAATKYPAVAEDPAFEPMRAMISADPLPLDPKTFKFAGALEAANVKLSPALNGAIKQLGYVYADGNLSELAQIAERAFRRGEFKMNRYLARAATAEDALKLAFGEHLPPPKTEVVMRELMEGAAERSPALQQDRAFFAALEEVRVEAQMDAVVETTLRNYRNIEDQIPSRLDQIQQASARNLIGAIPQSPELTGSRVIELATSRPQTTGATTNLAQAAQRYSDYLSVSFEAPSSDGSGGGGGGGGSPSSSRKSYQTRPPSSSYPGAQSGTSAPKVSRSYSAAIRSARAARGVAAGAKYSAPADVRPLNVAWVANTEDNRFGRIFVSLEGQGAPVIAASRTMFADSFRAAADVLWGGHHGTTAFREGEIFVVMSMDPFEKVDPEGWKQLEDEVAKFEAKIGQIDRDDVVALMGLLEEKSKLEKHAHGLSTKRRIVTHPSLFGRELAWSVARVDFWINNREGLSKEAALINGGAAMPEKFLQIPIEKAETWQFYERNASIRIAKGTGKLGQLIVQSDETTEATARSHYAVSMFVFDEDSEQTGEGKPLPELEAQLQPMLDWLAVNHHDFIRLNDFSESLMLLRWVKTHDIAPLVVDFHGEAPEIATPDHVVIGQGPKLPTTE